MYKRGDIKLKKNSNTTIIGELMGYTTWEKSRCGEEIFELQQQIYRLKNQVKYLTKIVNRKKHKKRGKIKK